MSAVTTSADPPALAILAAARTAEELEIAWAAGFLDGEGSFLIHRVKSKSPAASVLHRPLISVAQTGNPECLRRLRRLFTGHVVQATRKTSAGRTFFMWRLDSARELRRAIPRLLPYLIVKRAEAELVLELAERVAPRPVGPKRLTEFELVAREALARKLLALRREQKKWQAATSTG
jgi:hypothetical protein